MKILLLALAGAILSLQAYSQPKNRLWDTKIRKTCFYGIAASPVPIYDIAASDAKKVGMVSIYDSINFIHQMNGYWYVMTDKGGDGYVKNLRYRPIDLDSIKNAEKYRLLAIQAAKEKAALDSTLAAERSLRAYTMFDSATAQRILAMDLWEGMLPEMTEVALGEPMHQLSAMANGSTYDTWEYDNKCLYFNGGCLEYFYDAKSDSTYTPDVLLADLETGSSSKSSLPETTPAKTINENATEVVPASINPDQTEPDETDAVPVPDPNEGSTTIPTEPATETELEETPPTQQEVTPPTQDTLIETPESEATETEQTASPPQPGAN